MIVQGMSELKTSPSAKNSYAQTRYFYTNKKTQYFKADFVNNKDIFNKSSDKISFSGIRNLFLPGVQAIGTNVAVEDFTIYDIEKIMTAEEKALSKKVFNQKIRSGFSSLNGTFSSYMMASGAFRRYCRDGEETKDVRGSLSKTHDKAGRILEGLTEELSTEKAKLPDTKILLYERVFDAFPEKSKASPEKVKEKVDSLFPDISEIEELEAILDSNRKLYEEFSEKTKDFHDPEASLELETIDAVFDEIFPIYRQLKEHYTTALSQTRLN